MKLLTVITVIMMVTYGCSSGRVQVDSITRKGYLFVRDDKTRVGYYEIWSSDERLILGLIQDNPGSKCIVVEMEMVTGGHKEVIVGLTLPDDKINVGGTKTNLTQNDLNKVIIVP